LLARSHVLFGGKTLDDDGRALVGVVKELDPKSHDAFRWPSSLVEASLKTLGPLRVDIREADNSYVHASFQGCFHRDPNSNEAYAPCGVGHRDLPDLSQALRDAPPQIQRQVFQAFDLEIAYDKAEGKVVVSATVSESVAPAFENAKTLLPEGSSVVVRDIAGARYVSRYHPRIAERRRLAA